MHRTKGLAAILLLGTLGITAAVIPATAATKKKTHTQTNKQGEGHRRYRCRRPTAVHRCHRNVHFSAARSGMGTRRVAQL